MKEGKERLAEWKRVKEWMDTNEERRERQCRKGSRVGLSKERC